MKSHDVRRARLVAAVTGGLVIGTCMAGSALLLGQERPAEPVPRTPRPPASDPNSAGTTETAPPKKVLDKEPRKQVDSENIPTVKTGATFETTADGILVRRVEPETVAADTGLLPGDLIVRVAGKQVLTPIAFDRRLHNHRGGSKLEVVVLREGREKVLTLVLPRDHEGLLLDKPEEPPPRKSLVSGTDPAPAPVQPAVVEAAFDMGWVLQEKEHRVWIAEVKEESVAHAAGLKPGDLIVEVDRKAVRGTQAVYTRLAAHQSGGAAEILIDRAGTISPVSVTLPAVRRVGGEASTATVIGGRGVTLDEVIRRQQVQEELLVKVLAELEALRAELKARRD